MGQSVGTLLAHPLTGLALQVGYTWLSSVPEDSKVYGQQALLQSFSDAGIENLEEIMPDQEDYIRRIKDMEQRIEAERLLTRRTQESLSKMKQKLKEQMKKNAEMETYLASKPAKDVKMDSNVKLSSAEAARKNGIDSKNYINFAFVGHTKNGKSSLINAIRGLKKDDDMNTRAQIYR